MIVNISFCEKLYLNIQFEIQLNSFIKISSKPTTVAVIYSFYQLSLASLTQTSILLMLGSKQFLSLNKIIPNLLICFTKCRYIVEISCLDFLSNTTFLKLLLLSFDEPHVALFPNHPPDFAFPL